MAGFGFVRPKAMSVNPGDVPSFRDLPLRDKLMMLGSVLQGDQQGAMQIPLLAAARARQAEQQKLNGEFSRFLSGEGVPELVRTEKPAIPAANEPEADPVADATADLRARLSGQEEPALPRTPHLDVGVPQFDVIPGERREGPPTLRDAIPLLMRRRAAGIDIKPDIELLDKAGPDVDYVNGFRVDKRDPNGPAFLPSLDKDQEPLYDANGRIVAVRNVDGSVRSAAEMAGAVAGAQERAKAGFDLVEVPQADGSSVMMPRLSAVGALGGSGAPGVPEIPRSGSGGAPAGRRGGFGRTQTPADKTLAEGRAKTQVDVEALTPKAKSALDSQARTTDLVIDKLDEALGQIGRGSAGLADITKMIPGTPARNLDATLDTIRAAVGFDKLAEMRANSPTGGALGQVSDKENKLLQSVMGSMDQGQSPEQLAANLRRLRQELAAVKQERETAFARQFGGVADRAGGGRITPEMARAELARRRAAQGQ